MTTTSLHNGIDGTCAITSDGAGKRLAFSVFMMHILAAAWSMLPSEAYALCKRSGVLDNYLVPHYDVLHSMGVNALIEDVTGYIIERGFDICPS